MKYLSGQSESPQVIPAAVWRMRKRVRRMIWLKQRQHQGVNQYFQLHCEVITIKDIKFPQAKLCGGSHEIQWKHLQKQINISDVLLYKSYLYPSVSICSSFTSCLSIWLSLISFPLKNSTPPLYCSLSLSLCISPSLCLPRVWTAFSLSTSICTKSIQSSSVDYQLHGEKTKQGRHDTNTGPHLLGVVTAKCHDVSERKPVN